MRTFKVLVSVLCLVIFGVTTSQPIFAKSNLDSQPFQVNRDQILFVRAVNGESSIWIMNPDGTQKHEFINDPGGQEIGLIRPLDSHAMLSEITYIFLPNGANNCIARTITYPRVVTIMYAQTVDCTLKSYFPDHPIGDDRSRESLRQPFAGKMYNYSEDAGTLSLVGTCVSSKNSNPHLCYYIGPKAYIFETDLEGENFRMGFNPNNETGYYFDRNGSIFWWDPEGMLPTVDLTSVTR